MEMYLLSNLSYRLESITQIQLNETRRLGELADALNGKDGVRTAEIDWKIERNVEKQKEALKLGLNQAHLRCSYLNMKLKEVQSIEQQIQVQEIESFQEELSEIKSKDSQNHESLLLKIVFRCQPLNKTHKKHKSKSRKSKKNKKITRY